MIQTYMYIYIHVQKKLFITLKNDQKDDENKQSYRSDLRGQKKHIGNGLNMNKPRLSVICRLGPKRDKNKLCNLVKRRRSLYPSGGISTVQRTVFESDSHSHRTL